MRKPDPYIPSLLFSGIYREEPYEKWIRFSKSKTELNELLSIINSTPIQLSRWVEKRVSHNISRGIVIKNPLNYRLQVLRKGLVLMQECKFLCDVVENSLRHIYFIHLKSNGITYKNFHLIFRKWKSMSTKISSRIPFKEEDEISERIIMEMSFHELAQSIYFNWKHLNGYGYYNGFRTYFHSSKKYSDCEVFNKEVIEIIRKRRNDIAHSKRLFTPSEAENLFKITKGWIDALQMNFNNQISSYRHERPDFLKDIDIIKTVYNN